LRNEKTASNTLPLTARALLLIEKQKRASPQGDHARSVGDCHARVVLGHDRIHDDLWAQGLTAWPVGSIDDRQLFVLPKVKRFIRIEDPLTSDAFYRDASFKLPKQTRMYSE
jgi:hypothetical protein